MTWHFQKLFSIGCKDIFTLYLETICIIFFRDTAGFSEPILKSRVETANNNKVWLILHPLGADYMNTCYWTSFFSPCLRNIGRILFLRMFGAIFSNTYQQSSSIKYVFKWIFFHLLINWCVSGEQLTEIAHQIWR